MPFKWTVETFIVLPETMTIYFCINFFIKVDHKHRLQLRFEELRSAKQSSVQTKRNLGKQYCTVKLNQIISSSHVFRKNRKLCGWQSLACVASVRKGRERGLGRETVREGGGRSAPKFPLPASPSPSPSHFRCLVCCVVEFNYKCPFNTGWQQ